MDEERIGIKTPEYVSLQFQLAGLGSRAAAFMVDQIIIIAANILVLVTLLIVLTGGPDIFELIDADSLLLGLAIVLIFIINIGYFIVLEYFWGGQTIGKRIIGIRAMQENGHSLTLLASFIRNLLRIVDSLPGGYFIGIIMIFFHSKHKRVGDLVAGTIVIHERKTKNKKRKTSLEKEITRRGIRKEDLAVDEWTIKSIGQKEWNLIKTYSERFVQLPQRERSLFTKKMANLLFPKLNIELTGKTDYDLENTLLIIYLNVRDEWEYEL